MRLWSLVWRELLARPGASALALCALIAGVAICVALRSVLQASEADLAYKLDGLGANVLVLPAGTAVGDYYSADLAGAVMPEAHATRLALSDLKGLDNVSPKLSLPVQVRVSDERRVTLTGILPRAEFAAKGAWKGAGVFGRPTADCGPDTDTPPALQPETAIRRRRIETLEADQVLVGADVAQRFGIAAGETLKLRTRSFQVLEILPLTGTVDDARIFAHLHEVQAMAGQGEVINAIEIVGCCREIAKGLADGVASLLPDTRVVTITQIVETQQQANRTMASLSWLTWGLALLLGGGGILAALLANVRERRQELGVFTALGATRATLARLVVAKAVLLGFVGGLLGWGTGTVLASTLGPSVMGINVALRPDLLPAALGGAVVLAALGGLLPALRAARLEPADALRQF